YMEYGAMNMNRMPGGDSKQSLGNNQSVQKLKDQNSSSGIRGGNADSGNWILSNDAEGKAKTGVLFEAKNESSKGAAKNGNYESKTQNYTRDNIIDSLDGVTIKSTEIANALRNKDIGINVLGDELFERYFGCSSDTIAIQIGNQIYVRNSSVSLLSDVVHEGTHALDYLNGISESTISSWSGETAAYSAERDFQMESGMSVQYENEEDMMIHIWSNYKKK
ncbi:hypothetical protein AALB52_23805, partial [Lachnospiraceae bacterium 38-14]